MRDCVACLVAGLRAGSALAGTREPVKGARVLALMMRSQRQGSAPPLATAPGRLLANIALAPCPCSARAPGSCLPVVELRVLAPPVPSCRAMQWGGVRCAPFVGIRVGWGDHLHSRFFMHSGLSCLLAARRLRNKQVFASGCESGRSAERRVLAFTQPTCCRVSPAPPLLHGVLAPHVTPQALRGVLAPHVTPQVLHRVLALVATHKQD